MAMTEFVWGVICAVLSAWVAYGILLFLLRVTGIRKNPTAQQPISESALTLYLNQRVDELVEQGFARTGGSLTSCALIGLWEGRDGLRIDWNGDGMKVCAACSPKRSVLLPSEKARLLRADWIRSFPNYTPEDLLTGEELIMVLEAQRKIK